MPLDELDLFDNKIINIHMFFKLVKLYINKNLFNDIIFSQIPDIKHVCTN